MGDKSFDKKVREIVQPKLKELGFKRVKLDRCMCPEFLYRNDRLWFSLSWDWRDRYFEVSLGRLHWFKDVMERFVVIGDYENFDNRITPSAIDNLGGEAETLKIIASSLENAVSQCETDYERILQDYRVSRSGRKGINIDNYIGPEATDDDLRKFAA